MMNIDRSYVAIFWPVGIRFCRSLSSLIMFVPNRIYKVTKTTNGSRSEYVLFGMIPTKLNKEKKGKKSGKRNEKK